MTRLAKAKKLIKHLTRNTSQKVIASIIVIAIASLGVYLLTTIRAASPDVSQEASSGTLNDTTPPGCAVVTPDSRASNGQSVQFDPSLDTPPSGATAPPGSFNVTDATYAGGATPYQTSQAIPYVIGSDPNIPVLSGSPTSATQPKDSSVAISAAITAAENAEAAAIASTGKPVPETIYFPAGVYFLNNPNVSITYDKSLEDDNDMGADGYLAAADFTIDQPDINILGAGKDKTELIEEVGNAATLPANQMDGPAGPYASNVGVNPATGDEVGLGRGSDVFVFAGQTKTSPGANNFYFSGLTVDAQSYNAGDALWNHGNCTTIENSIFLGSINGPGLAGTPTQYTTILDTFDIRDTAFCNQNPSRSNFLNKAAGYHYGNIIQNLTLVSAGGYGGNDDLDFSCEQDGIIRNITDTGWGTAEYLDRNVTVSNYNFTPGSNKDVAIPGGKGLYGQFFAGFYITDGYNITINNFTTSGQGGIISSPNYPSQNISINNEDMTDTTDPNYILRIGDATNVTVTDSTINKYDLDPTGDPTAPPNGYNPPGGLYYLTVSPTFSGTVACGSATAPIEITQPPGIACP